MESPFFFLFFFRFLYRSPLTPAPPPRLLSSSRWPPSDDCLSRKRWQFLWNIAVADLLSTLKHVLRVWGQSIIQARNFGDDCSRAEQHASNSELYVTLPTGVMIRKNRNKKEKCKTRLRWTKQKKVQSVKVSRTRETSSLPLLRRDKKGS